MRVATARIQLTSGNVDIRHTGRVTSGRTALVDYAGQALRPRAAPLTVTEAAVTIAVATGVAAVERPTVEVLVQFANPPSDVLNHVAFCEPSSDRAQNPTTSAHSGTNVEASPTRHFTNVRYLCGWIAFDLAVEPGKPFIPHAIETYGQTQLKEHQVLVHGVVAHNRSYRHVDSGAGTVAYQFVVDLTEATRRRRAGSHSAHRPGYAPSIADA